MDKAATLSLPHPLTDMYVTARGTVQATAIHHQDDIIPFLRPQPDTVRDTLGYILIFTHIFSEHKEIEGMVANLILDFQVAATP
jgi:hypothetical protein